MLTGELNKMGLQEINRQDQLDIEGGKVTIKDAAVVAAAVAGGVAGAIAGSPWGPGASAAGAVLFAAAAGGATAAIL